MKLPLMALSLALAAPALVSAADDKPLTFITTADLVEKTKAPQAKWDFTIVDARTRVEYNDARLAGSINVPAKQTKELLPKLVADKKRTLIFYCNGPKCTKSQKAARAALALGYSNVLEYNEGLPAWAMGQHKIEGNPLPQVDVASVAREALQEQAKDGKLFVADIRDADEYPNFFLKGSKNIPLDDIEKRVKEFPADRPIVLVDHAGHQTLMAGRLLSRLGRKDVRRLDGGLIGWQQAGLPLENTAVAKQ